MIEQLEGRRLLSAAPPLNIVIAVPFNTSSGVLTVFGARDVMLTAQADGSIDVLADGQTYHAVAWGNEGQGVVPISEVDVLATAPGSNLIVLNTNDAHPITAVIDTDWYPASYPWHTVIELNRDQKRITIRKGEPLCRVIPVRRDTYFAQEMPPADFEAFFARAPEMRREAHLRYEHHCFASSDRTSDTSASIRLRCHISQRGHTFDPDR
jgi:hypothetical protein